MDYNPIEILEAIEKEMKTASDGEYFHLGKLKLFIEEKSSLKDIFLYGVDFLPFIVNKQGKKDLNLLDEYEPNILLFYKVLGECESISEIARDLAVDLSIYANGSSIEIDDRMYDLDPRKEIAKVFQKV